MLRKSYEYISADLLHTYTHTHTHTHTHKEYRKRKECDVICLLSLILLRYQVTAA